MIKVHNISVGFSPLQPLLKAASFEIKRGEVVALLGRNGAGKSTLMRTIAGLIPHHNGSIYINGVDLDSMSEIERATSISLVSTERIRVANLSCRQLVALGRTPYTNWIGRLTPKDHSIIDAALESVGMSHFANVASDTLSDGELQRIMIARAVAQESPILMLDEPTAFLDMPSRYDLMRLLKSLAHETNRSILFSTHELELAVKSSDRIAIVDTPELIITEPDQANSIISRLFSTL